MGDDALVITGPTASGKTALGVAVARRIAGEIISFDSRQIYRGMDIGTAKPDLDQRGGIPHHGFDRVDPGERYSAGRFAREAWSWIAAIRARGATPVLVGGTGFFLRALTHPLFEEPPLDESSRRSLRELVGAHTTEELQRWVRALDPELAVRSRGGGRQRMVRAIEIALLTGRPLTWWHANAATSHNFDPLIFVLELPRAELYRRIDERVAGMVERGLAAEVRALLARGYTEKDPGMSATGYREMVPFVCGHRSLEEAVRLTRSATRRYARRQITWFRHQLPADAVRLDATRPHAELADEISERWKLAGH